MATAAAPELEQLVFMLNKSLPTAEEMPYSVAEICFAAEKSSGFATVLGAQRLGFLWRGYPTNTDARVALLTKGTTLRGHIIQPWDKTPFIMREDGQEREIPSTKLVIGNVPLSYNKSDIVKVIEIWGSKCDLIYWTNGEGIVVAN